MARGLRPWGCGHPLLVVQAHVEGGSACVLMSRLTSSRWSRVGRSWRGCSQTGSTTDNPMIAMTSSMGNAHTTSTGTQPQTRGTKAWAREAGTTCEFFVVRGDWTSISYSQDSSFAPLGGRPVHGMERGVEMELKLSTDVTLKLSGSLSRSNICECEHQHGDQSRQAKQERSTIFVFEPQPSWATAPCRPLSPNTHAKGTSTTDCFPAAPKLKRNEQNVWRMAAPRRLQTVAGTSTAQNHRV